LGRTGGAWKNFESAFVILNKKFMITVRGVFENGTVKLLEPVPGKTGQRVIITFLDEENQWEADDIRSLSLLQPNKFFEEYLTDEREDLYQDYAKKKME
jgi:hypothetical protein